MKSQPIASSQLFLWEFRSMLLVVISSSFGLSPDRKRGNLSQIPLSLFLQSCISYRCFLKEYITELHICVEGPEYSFPPKKYFLVAYPDEPWEPNFNLPSPIPETCQPTSTLPDTWIMKCSIQMF